MGSGIPANLFVSKSGRSAILISVRVGSSVLLECYSGERCGG